MTDKDQHKPLFDKLEPPRKRQMFDRTAKREMTEWSKSGRDFFELVKDLLWEFLH